MLAMRLFNKDWLALIVRGSIPTVAMLSEMLSCMRASRNWFNDTDLRS